MDAIYQGIFNFALTLLIFIPSITIHELAHGYTAYLLGDSTAKDDGRLTFNPLAHLDITGILFMVFFRFGWAKPVPVNPNNLKNIKRDYAVISLAGPMSNFTLAFLGFFLFPVLEFIKVDSKFIDLAYQIVRNFIFINIGLGIFNLMPVPPLDGSKILGGVLPDRVYYNMLNYQRFGFIILIILINIPFFQAFILNLVSVVYSAFLYIVLNVIFRWNI